LKKSNEPLLIEEFEYDLPPELIAQEPLAIRHQSKLLYLHRPSGQIDHLQFADIVEILQAGDTLVVNNTKVIPARIWAKRASGGQIKLLLLKPEAEHPGVWEALVTPIKRLKPGEQLNVETVDGKTQVITVKDIITGHDGFKRLLVDLGSREHVFELLSSIGRAPLPPYIQRSDDVLRLGDLERYQTVYAAAPGAVAAPTAGLHFSNETLAALRAKGVVVEQITLHVGPGTFKPIAGSVDNHAIEPENFTIPHSVAARINDTKERGGRVIAVGTTSLRALESAAENGRLKSVDNGSSTLYVKPGFEFQIVDGMVTNFHLSRSSLLVLVSAFAGREQIMHAYQEAIERHYRFFSYGDAMLIL
jgi:S-adenosylmethionine:tRNA ribosyltransferase-isomerase